MIFSILRGIFYIALLFVYIYANILTLLTKLYDNMKLLEVLCVDKKPKGWSIASYYRARSVSKRILECNNTDVEITNSNLNSVLENIHINVNYKNGKPNYSNRTYKTYLTEIKRYIKYNLKEFNNGNKKSKRA